MWRLLILLIISPSMMAETITVSVNTNGKSEYQIRQEGKRKVSIEMLDRMPAIISGKETLINGNLSTSIKSLTLSAVDVVPIEETWDRANQFYTLTANATVDEATVRALFQNMKKNAEMKKMLTESYTRIAELQKQLNQQSSIKLKEDLKTDTSTQKGVESESIAIIIAGFEQRAALIKAGLIDKDEVFKFRKEASTFFVDSLFAPYKNSYSVTVERDYRRKVTWFYLEPTASTKRYFTLIKRYNKSVPYMQFEHLCLGTRAGSDRQIMRESKITFRLDVKEEYKELLGDPVIYPC